MENLPNENYIKKMKNGLSIISCISLIMNLFTLNDLTIIFTSSLVYFCSAALAFYSVMPKSDKGVERRHQIISGSIYIIVGLICGIILENTIEDVYVYVLYSIRVLVSFFSIVVPVYSIMDDIEYITEDEKVIKNKARKKLENLSSNKRYRVSREKGKNRIVMSRFVEEKEKDKSKNRTIKK